MTKGVAMATKTIIKTLDYATEIRSGTVQPDTQSPPADESEFQRFAELAGKLAQIPKSELDEKRQEA
jgi:hypothetical protein